MQKRMKVTALAIVSLVYGLNKALATVVENEESPQEFCNYSFHVVGNPQIQCQVDQGDLERMKYALEHYNGNLNALVGEVDRLKSSMADWKESLSGLLSMQENEGVLVGDIGAQNAVGTTYTRWGNTGCPATASRIYTGYAAKSLHTSGGGVNYLCLPQSPEFHKDVEGGHQSMSYVHGAKYLPLKSPLIPADRKDKLVACSLCEVTGRTRIVVLVAHNSCPAGWTLEYKGHLMSQRYSEKGATFECVDEAMESPATSTDMAMADGPYLYVAEAACGSIKCPPYSEGIELSCRVCTK